MARHRGLSRRNADNGGVLEFETIVHGIFINGVDIIRLTDDRQRIVSYRSRS